MRKLLAVALLALAVPSNAAAAPEPGSPEYVQRDMQNIADAYGRQTAPDGQFNNPDYHVALQFESTDNGLKQLAEQAAAANRLALTPGQFFPGWNTGNPFRRGWAGRRGVQVPVSWTNRHGALIRGNAFAPLPGATDPYTGEALEPPYPGVVITTGSVQGSERMYFWLAQDLAERGYVVLTYDVQGQGRSETLPHQDGENNALPFCSPLAEPADGESYGCPGVPAQQDSNFIFGTEDALSFFLSTPAKPYPNPSGGDQPVNAFNPLWKLWDRRPDKRSVTPGRTTRVAIIGHSLGARAISHVQGVDDRVQVAVALDKLALGGDVQPVVPALALQAEYGFNVFPYWWSGGSSIAPRPGSPAEGPDPKREQAGGFDLWRKAGVDTMLVVPRASTHLEWTDIPYALPASRYGQAFSSYYVQAWLDRYMKHKGEPGPKPKARGKRKAKRLMRRWRGRRARLARMPDPLLASSFSYLEPKKIGKWEPITLERAKQLSLYYCSGWAFRDRVTKRMKTNLDPAGVGCSG